MLGDIGQSWLVLYNQAEFVSVLKKHLVIGQFFRSRLVEMFIGVSLKWLAFFIKLSNGNRG